MENPRCRPPEKKNRPALAKSPANRLDLASPAVVERFSESMSPEEKMRRIDDLLSHVWMVRTFVKHSEEAEEDDDLNEVHRKLYDFMLALGNAWKQQDADAYLKQAGKKLRRLREATELFAEIQPEVSTHTNFQMARHSLEVAVNEIAEILK
jgi:hypothetical protein